MQQLQNLAISSENMTEPYKRLTEENSGSHDLSALGPNPHNSSENTHQHGSVPTTANVFISHQSPVPSTALHSPKLMKHLAILQLLLSIAILLLTVLCFIIIAIDGRMITNAVGTGIWNGILAVIAASFGLMVTLRGHYRGRCAITTYFVLSIIVTVFMGFLVLMSIIWSGVASSEIGRYKRYQQRLANWEEQERRKVRGHISRDETVDYGYSHRPHFFGASPATSWAALGIHIAIGLMALGHMVSTIVSLAMICYTWNRAGAGCCGKQLKEFYPSVVYDDRGGVIGANANGLVTNNEQPHQNQQFVMVPVASFQQQNNVQAPVACGIPPEPITSPIAYPPPAYYD